MISTLPAVNHWPDARCAKAFWGQHDLPPYRKLLADTLDWADPQPGERWLDLGCGGGALSRGLWERSRGTLGEVVGVDCAGANSDAYARIQQALGCGNRVRFLRHDFSEGLTVFSDAAFDRVVSGLSITYAESRDPITGNWTTAGYDRLLAEVYRVLRPGGRFVFSVNVPEPSWGRVAFGSLAATVNVRRPLIYLKRSWRMLRYGTWLKREARVGRFHYFPAPVIVAKLESAGFRGITHRLSYSNQAYIFRADKGVA